MAQYTGDYTANGRTADAIKDKAGETMERMIEGAQDAASTAKKKTMDAAQTVGDKAGELTERIQDSSVYASVCKTAREQPLATLAGAVAIGFVAGALWKLTTHTNRQPSGWRASFHPTQSHICAICARVSGANDLAAGARSPAPALHPHGEQ